MHPMCVCERGTLWVHLGLFHSHLAFVSVAVETIRDLPHTLTRAHALHKIGWEQSHLVSAFPLEHTHTHTHILNCL